MGAQVSGDKLHRGVWGHFISGSLLCQGEGEGLPCSSGQGICLACSKSWVPSPAMIGGKKKDRQRQCLRRLRQDDSLLAT